MRQNLLIATTNQGKKEEITKVLKNIPLFTNVNILTLGDISTPLEDVEETGTTFRDNALLKAEYYYEKIGIPVISDDSGLVVPILNGEPGVISARYSGENATSAKNMQLLLSKLENHKERDAYFITSMIFYMGKGSFIDVEGRIYGTISHSPEGTNGFGYDAIFYIPDKDKTVAQLTPKEKREISHRTQALKLLLPHIQKWIIQ